MMDKHSSHHTYCGILLSDEKEETTAPCYSIDDSQNDYAEQKKSDTEDIQDSTYMKLQAQLNVQWQKADQCYSGGRAGGVDWAEAEGNFLR